VTFRIFHGELPVFDHDFPAFCCAFCGVSCEAKAVVAGGVASAGVVKLGVGSVRSDSALCLAVSTMGSNDEKWRFARGYPLVI